VIRELLLAGQSDLTAQNASAARSRKAIPKANDPPNPNEDGPVEFS